MRLVTYQPRLIYPDIPQLARSDYEDGLQTFIRRFREGFPGRAAIYQFGEVRTPGVSDIDLLIVVEDDHWRAARQAAHSAINENGVLHFLFAHEPLVFPHNLLPGLRHLHTLENCRRADGDWDPLSDTGGHPLDSASILLRHVVWSSFMRAAAAEMDDTVIGVRRALVLAHNLLTSAQSGNALLANPLRLTISTETVRQNIISASIRKQEQLVRASIREILDLLNRVDSELDRQLGSNLGFPIETKHIIRIAPNRFAISPLCSNIAEETTGRQRRILRTVRLVPTPAYQIQLVNWLSYQIPGRYRCLSPLHKQLSQQAGKIDLQADQYIQSLVQAIKLCHAQGYRDLYIRPFAYREPRKTWRASVKNRLQSSALAQLIDA